MAPRTGKDGWVSVQGSSERPTYIDSWSINAGVGTAEITGFGENSKAFAHTIREWSGSISGTFDGSDTHQATIRNIFTTTSQASVSCRFYLTSTESFRGTAFPTNYSVNSSLGDKVSWSCDLQGSSNLTFSTTGA